MIFPYNIYNLSPQTQPFSPKISILAEATAPPPAQWSRQDGVGDGFGDGDGDDGGGMGMGLGVGLSGSCL